MAAETIAGSLLLTLSHSATALPLVAFSSSVMTSGASTAVLSEEVGVLFICQAGRNKGVKNYKCKFSYVKHKILYACRCMTKSWGLALSGGSAFGIANAGVIEVLERENLRPNCIVGSSMGAIVGALWALGCTTKDMRAVCSGLSLLSVASLSDTPFQGGL